MRILWLPHQDWDFIRRGQRESRLARFLKSEHDMHFMAWREPRADRRAALASLTTKTWHEDGLTIHQERRIPNFLGSRVHQRSGRGLWINEQLHQRSVRALVAREKIDVVLCGISHQAVGLPPADLGVPVIFDYLDFKLESWPQVEAEYMARVDAVLCTSRVLVERVERMHPHTYYLPNGVDLGAAEHADAERVRRQYGLDGAKVVSLIGLTASAQMFYVDGIAAAAQEVPNLVLMLVGDPGELGSAMVRRAEEHGLRTVVTGPVPPSEVADFFAATDVGLYPGDKNAYFDAASPLKILEYTAAGKPVVATDLKELRNWAFPNVRLAEPTAEAYHREVKQALEQPPDGYPDLSGFSWATLAERLNAILGEVVARGKR
jgi:glycosyltransferase involved in cell wall biosynthesis